MSIILIGVVLLIFYLIMKPSSYLIERLKHDKKYKTTKGWCPISDNTETNFDTVRLKESYINSDEFKQKIKHEEVIKGLNL